MLSGYLPFYSPIYEEVVEQTKLCNVTLRNSNWSNVSKPAKELIEGLLTFNESKMWINKIIHHGWIKDLQNLKQFNGMNKRPNKMKFFMSFKSLSQNENNPNIYNLFSVYFLTKINVLRDILFYERLLSKPSNKDERNSRINIYLK
jgi:hypothetical protein